MEYYIKEEAWSKVFEYLKKIKGLHIKDEGQIRRFMEAVWYMARSGCQWRLLPSYYGKWRSIHQRFRRWQEAGIWEKMMAYCVEADLEWGMIDATIVRAHACSAGYGKNSQEREALGRSKGGFTTKIHALVDALGNPLKFVLSPGQRHDITQAEKLIEGSHLSVLIADKGYDSNALVHSIEASEGRAVIPPRSSRKNPRFYDKDLYKERHLIECFFGKLKHFRRVFSRFDKDSSSFLAFLHFVGALIWLR
jgi:transposase